MKRVHLVDVGTWMPQRWMTAAEIGAAAGIDEAVIIERFGLDGKHIAGPDDHISTMSAGAGKVALQRAGIDPGDVDVVAYFGSMWKDYTVWSASPKIANLIGAHHAWAFEMGNVSCGGPIALKAVGDVLRGSDDVETVLVVGASRESHLLDYTNQRSRFMFNFGDGAAAAVLSTKHPGHEVVASAVITDGRFADDVAVYGGGSRHPASLETVRRNLHTLDVADPVSMKERLDPVSGPNFIGVARRACEKAGITPADLALLAPLHTKRSIFEWMITELGVPEEKTVYLRRHGHMSGIDPLVGLDKKREELEPGDWVLLLSAGTGYTWAATVVRW